MFGISKLTQRFKGSPYLSQVRIQHLVSTVKKLYNLKSLNKSMQELLLRLKHEVKAKHLMEDVVTGVSPSYFFL